MEKATRREGLCLLEDKEGGRIIHLLRHGFENPARPDANSPFSQLLTQRPAPARTPIQLQPQAATQPQTGGCTSTAPPRSRITRNPYSAGTCTAQC